MSLPSVGTGALRGQGIGTSDTAPPSQMASSLPLSRPPRLWKAAQTFQMNGGSSEEEVDAESGGTAREATTAHLHDPSDVESTLSVDGLRQRAGVTAEEQRQELPGDQRHSGEHDWHDHGHLDHWACLGCGSRKWCYVSGTWTCQTCSGHDYYRVDRSTRHQVPTGTWVYVPHGTGLPDSHSSSHEHEGHHGQGKRQRRRRHRKGHPDEDPSESRGDEEQAESEAPTHDPSIPVSEHGPERTRPFRSPPAPPAHRDMQEGIADSSGHNPEERLIQALKKMLAKDDKDDNRSWDSMRGPKPGVRFRGGAAPQPPLWRFHAQV